MNNMRIYDGRTVRLLLSEIKTYGCKSNRAHSKCQLIQVLPTFITVASLRPHLLPDPHRLSSEHAQQLHHPIHGSTGPPSAIEWTLLVRLMAMLSVRT